MPRPDPRKSDTATAAHLAELFGGTWTRWNGGPAGIPDGALWTQHDTNSDGRPVMTGMLLFDERITSHALRKIPVSALEGALAGDDEQRQTEMAALPPLERGDLPMDEFAQIVAEHFKFWSRYSAKPSRDMAINSGVKENTVYSWVREARQRGLIPPAAQRGQSDIMAPGRFRLADDVPFEVEVLEPAGKHTVAWSYDGRVYKWMVDGFPGPVGVPIGGGRDASAGGRDRRDGVWWDLKVHFVG